MKWKRSYYLQVSGNTVPKTASQVALLLLSYNAGEGDIMGGEGDIMGGESDGDSGAEVSDEESTALSPSREDAAMVFSLHRGRRAD